VEDLELRKEGENLSLKLEIQRLEMENKRLQNEIAEARMLIDLYENGFSSREMNL
jgi:hypothetical protein